MEGESEFNEKRPGGTSGGGGTAAEGMGSGGRVKAHVLEKASLIPRENAMPTTWHKRWPLGKGNY
jgi:hypothetical protein